MARVRLFSDTPNVQDQGTTDARMQSFDHGGEAIGRGIEQFGRSMQQAGDTLNQIADVDARTEANRLLVEHSKLTTQLNQTVSEAQGENAKPAVDDAYGRLETGTGDILSRASKRAKLILEPEVQLRNAKQNENWHGYAFDQHKTAFESNAVAANGEDLDQAIAQPDEASAAPYLDAIRQRNEDRAHFFGWGKEQLQREQVKTASTFFKQRALNMAAAGDPLAAVHYADSHAPGSGNGSMTPDDYADIQRSYLGSVMEQSANMAVEGTPDPSGVTTSSVVPIAGATEGQHTADPQAVWNSVIVPNEGSAYVIDVNGYGVKYGINGKANPGINIKGLTSASAFKIFNAKYWQASGADKLPPALAALHADTYYLSTKAAPRILKQSGGNFEQYMRLRKEWLASLHNADPVKFNDTIMKSWARRDQNITKFAAMTPGGGVGAPPQTAQGNGPFSFSGNLTAYSDKEAIRKEVRAHAEMPYAYQNAVIEAASRRIDGMKGAIDEKERLAHDQAWEQVNRVGFDKFTDISQLDPNTATQLSAQDFASFTRMAKTTYNQNKVDELAPYVTATEFANKPYFLSKGFTDDLIKKGAPAEYVAKVRQRQATMLSQPSDPLNHDQVWSIASPVYEAMGLHYDTLEAKEGAGDKAKAEERSADAQNKMLAINYLRNRAIDWATEHPGGEKPSEEEVKKWVGASLLKVGPQYLFQSNNSDLYNHMDVGQRRAIIKSLIRSGVMDNRTPPKETIRLVTEYIRAAWALRGFYDKGKQPQGPGQ